VTDSHCHLADEAFRDDLDAVVSRARGSGVEQTLAILALGDEREAAQADQLERLWPLARTAIGLHPHQAGSFRGTTDALQAAMRVALAGRATVRALGEIGLDYHYDFSPRDVQRTVFAAQVALARELSLPIVVHTREADRDTVDVLRQEGHGEVRGVFHCFTGSGDLARQALDLGFHVSFAGIVTFPKAEGLREVARLIPTDRLLVETDSPFLAPVPHRGKRNEPAHVTAIVGALATSRHVARDELEAAVDRNFQALFAP
jgi:TatD DNase family protein